MRTSILSLVPLLAIASAQTTGKLGDALVVENNPAGASYIATLPNKAGTALRGYVLATAGQGGKGVNFAVNFVGIPSEGGPFLYHLHDQPVPADGNCTSTLAHLDPFQRGEDPVCDASKPATCQVGDLSGKYGKPQNGSTFSASYTDPYAALVPGIGAFFGNRSIVFHYANKTRISCANFVQLNAAATAQGGASCAVPVDSSSSSASSVAAVGSSSTDVSGVSQSTTAVTGTPVSTFSTTPTSSRAIVQATTAGAPPERWVNSAALLGGVAAAALML